MFVDADDYDHCQMSECGGLYANVMRLAYNMSALANVTRIAAMGLNSGVARTSFLGWLTVAGISNSLVDFITYSTNINSLDFTHYRFVYVPSSSVSHDSSNTTSCHVHIEHSTVKACVGGIFDSRHATYYRSSAVLISL